MNPLGELGFAVMYPASGSATDRAEERPDGFSHVAAGDPSEEDATELL